MCLIEATCLFGNSLMSLFSLTPYGTTAIFSSLSILVLYFYTALNGAFPFFSRPSSNTPRSSVPTILLRYIKCFDYFFIFLFNGFPTLLLLNL